MITTPVSAKSPGARRIFRYSSQQQRAELLARIKERQRETAEREAGILEYEKKARGGGSGGVLAA